MALLIGAVLVLGMLFNLAFPPSPPLPHYPRYEALMAAVDKHDAKTVRLLLNQGTNPNEYPNDPDSIQAEADYTVLNCAVDDGDEAIVTLLLDHHADPNMGDGWHDSPLAAAAAKNNVSLMKLLIRRDAKVNDSPDWSSALWRAAMDGKVEATAFLLAHGANPRITAAHTTLLDAVRSSVTPNPKIIALLVKAGAYSASPK